MPEYQPGVCNIGRDEIRKRYSLAVIGFTISALAVYTMILLGWPRLAMLLSFVPLAMSFEGLYQGYFRFCAGFAAAGIYDFAGSGGSRSKVSNSKDHKEDLMKARQIHIYSLASGAAVAVIVYLVF